MADADASFDIKEIRRRMDGAVASLKSEFGGLRTGRASTGILDPIMVNAYGQTMPINQVGTVGAPEPRMLTVQVWDKGMVGAVDKAIRTGGLGLNPVVDGTTLRIPIPPLNEERRAELAKVASRYAESARVAARNVRRDGMDTLKRMEKAGDISEDEHKAHAEDVQSATDACISAIDAALKTKEEEIMQV